MAGAAFWPSTLPMRIGREVDGFVIEMIDSVGLPGRAGDRTSLDAEDGTMACSNDGRVGLRASRGLVALTDVTEPLMMARRRRRSSKGAPAAAVWSILNVRTERGVPGTGDLADKSECDPCFDTERGPLRNTV